MSQNPLAGIRRKSPVQRREFPDADYARDVLAPEAARAEELLGASVIDVYRAHVVQLAEQRVVEPSVAGRALARLEEPLPGGGGSLALPLSGLDEGVVAATSPELALGQSAEERLIAATRMVLRREVLDLAVALVDLRVAAAELAGQHLTTLVLATEHGQIVQPTSLGHYLAAQLGPLARATTRLVEAYARVNRSPLGAVSGMATAMPVRRQQTADWLGFDGLIDNTFDAIAATDDLTEIASVVAGTAVELSRLVNDLNYWARDDVGLIVPGDEYVHHVRIQPQRRDPLVLEHLRLSLAAQAASPQALVTQLVGRQMLGTMSSRLAATFAVVELLRDARASYRLLARVLSTLAVHRSMVAHRSHRGFSTSSELADLLAIDFRFPADQARSLAERVVLEWTESGGEATTLTSEFIDEVALREVGREVGIEPETLAKCLSPKRFVERRDVPGGPAPAAVTAQLDRATFSVNHDRGWQRERVQALADARERLDARCRALAADPAGALRHQAPRPSGEGSDGKIGDI